MTDPGPAESCQVSLLIPHPGRTAILVAEQSTRDPPRLPTLRMSSAEPLVSEILAVVDVVDTDTTAVLRQVTTSAEDGDDAEPGEDGEVSLVVEFDCPTTEPSAGWIWQ